MSFDSARPRTSSSRGASGRGPASGERRGSGRPRRSSGAPRPAAAPAARIVTREPRPAATSFADAGLPKALVDALARQGKTAPFAIQAAALPDALAGENLLGRAHTGAGKTLGFGIPVLARLASRPGGRAKHPRALILVPTRELAQQVSDALAPLARPLDLHLVSVYGGTSIGKQIANLTRPGVVLVATPGRLVDLLERNAVALDDVETAVVDEADHMCDLGFLPVVKRLLSLVPAEAQKLLFSATLDGQVDALVRQFLPEPVLVALDPEVGQVVKLEHHAFEARDRSAKVALVTTLASGRGRTLLFSRTKHGADRLAKQLSNDGVPAAALHGGMAQAARTRSLKSFSDGTTRVLVATDVAARGVHVDNIDLVVHADPPEEHKAYLHRSGRTARAGQAGTVVTVSTPEQRRDVEKLLRAAGTDIRPVGVTPDDPRVLDVVGPLSPKVSLEEQQEASRRAAAARAAASPQRERGSRTPGRRFDRPDRDGRHRTGGGERRGTESAAGGRAPRPAGAAHPRTGGVRTRRTDGGHARQS
jgi:superfamily II DNA/RNA helicase